MASATSSRPDSAQEHAIMDRKVFGHPAGLFVLFFTEMWERFSFYGMRVLLINFLTMAIIGINPGWEWSIENATALYGTYAALLYLTPILGGIIADKYIGARRSVIIGCTVMALGHACMAVETEFSLYLGLALLVIGTGFFKPNMTSIISKMYAYLPEKEDSAYTLYYMGVNSGAFFGMMLCGYLGERIGWSWGFGLAGVFMIFGTVQFIFAKKIFGGVGEPPKKIAQKEAEIAHKRKEKSPKKEAPQSEKPKKSNRFKIIDVILIVVASLIGLLYIFNEPTSKIGNFHLLPEKFIFPTDVISGANMIILIGVLLFLVLIGLRISRYQKIIRDRMIALIIFALFTVVFFGAFEQAATSMITFARDFTQRVLTGTAATIYNIVNTLLTIIPLLIVTWVLYVLNKRSFMKIPVSNIVLGLCFTLMWGLAIWMLYQNYSSQSYEASYQSVAIEKIKAGNVTYEPLSPGSPIHKGQPTDHDNPLSYQSLSVGDSVAINLVALGKEVSPQQSITVNSATQKVALNFAEGKITTIGDTHALVHVDTVISARSSILYTPSDEINSSADRTHNLRVAGNSSNKDLKLEEIIAVPLQKGEFSYVHPENEKQLQLDYQDQGQPLKYAKGRIVQAQGGHYKVQIDTIATGKSTIVYEPVTKARPLYKGEATIAKNIPIASSTDLDVGQKIYTHQELDKYRFLNEDKLQDLKTDYAEAGLPSKIIQGKVSKINESEVEITVSWFSILNSFFIIAFSSIFSKWWESKYNPSAAIKYGLGLILMGVGFAILAYGSRVIPQGAAPGMIRVGMVWLILLYLFNTLGELCLSPVGLSYLSKLVPARMIGFMFGMWYLAIAIGNYVAAKLGGMSEQIQENQGMSTFFLIFALIPIVVGVIAILLNRPLKKLMHGVR